MAMAAAQSLLRLLTPRRPVAASLTGAAGVAGSSALRSSGLRTGRLVSMRQRLAPLHGAAVVCSAASSGGVVEVQLKVDGMVCDGCSSRVEEVLAQMKGVKKVHVDLEKGLATVVVEAGSQADAMQPLAEAIKGLGFDAEPHCAES